MKIKFSTFNQPKSGKNLPVIHVVDDNLGNKFCSQKAQLKSKLYALHNLSRSEGVVVDIGAEAPAKKFLSNVVSALRESKFKEVVICTIIPVDGFETENELDKAASRLCYKLKSNRYDGGVKILQPIWYTHEQLKISEAVLFNAHFDYAVRIIGDDIHIFKLVGSFGIKNDVYADDNILSSYFYEFDVCFKPKKIIVDLTEFKSESGVDFMIYPKGFMTKDAQVCFLMHEEQIPQFEYALLSGEKRITHDIQTAIAGL